MLDRTHRMEPVFLNAAQTAETHIPFGVSTRGWIFPGVTVMIVSFGYTDLSVQAYGKEEAGQTMRRIPMVTVQGSGKDRCPYSS
ncbi:MAG: hypothetical protein V2B18_16140 [Pseudomonadota bacterium]